MPLELTKQEIQDVVKYIKKHVEEKHNCRVGFALKQVMTEKYGIEKGQSFGKSFHNIEKVGHACIEDSKYTKSTPIEFPKDISIHKAPVKNFKEKYWWIIAILGWGLGWTADLGKEVYLQDREQQETKIELQSLKTKYTDLKHISDSLSREILLRDSLRNPMLIKTNS